MKMLSSLKILCVALLFVLLPMASNADKTVFSENFQDGISSNWTIIDGYNDGLTWTAADPGAYGIGAPFSKPMAIVDSR